MNFIFWTRPWVVLKVRKCQKQISFLSFPPKNKRKCFHSALDARAEIGKDFCLCFGGKQYKEIYFWDFLTFRTCFYLSKQFKFQLFWVGLENFRNWNIISKFCGLLRVSELCYFRFRIWVSIAYSNFFKVNLKNTTYFLALWHQLLNIDFRLFWLSFILSRKDLLYVNLLIKFRYS